MAVHRGSSGAMVRQRLWLLAVMLVAAAAVPALGAPSHVINAPLNDEDDDPYRLPDSVTPDQYTLELEPDLDTELFSGKVTIEVEAHAAVESIKLHSLGLTLGKVEVNKILENDLLSDNMYVDKSNYSNYEMVALDLNGPLETGEKYRIYIEYDGKLQDNMYGFYVSTYTYDGKRKLAATQFQATHARKAFPCFDEPKFKARFKIKIIVEPPYQCLSNMPVENIIMNIIDYRNEYIFYNSLKMSSYLVAFVVSEFGSVEDYVKDLNEVVIKTWARPNAISSNWTSYSLEVTRPMLKILESFTGINYIDNERDPPLNKIDQVALPDFSAGAMENWGLITYRETALLFNDGSAEAKKRVATVIAHELLHMWFGNLITTEWWSTTWLNEGFARYFQYYVTNALEEGWRMWDQFVVDQHQMVFALDSLLSAEALTHPVSNASEASASFGTITYSKGGSVLRMIRYMIGENNFQSALREYLNKNKYKNVIPENLFQELSVYAGEANLSEELFGEFLLSWTEQPGFPVVKVTRDYDNNACTLTQKRFLYKNSSPHQYIIPLTWTEQGGSFDTNGPQNYLQKDTILDIKDLPDETKWVIFNLQETGYYRVNYDDTNWKLISSHLNDRSNDLKDIHLLNRAQLLDDAFNLARASDLSYDIVLDLADYLSRETDLIPWTAALSGFTYMDRMLVNHAKYPVFQRYVSRLIARAYGLTEQSFVLNSAPTPHEEKLLMNRIATWACKLGHTGCIEHSIFRLRYYLDGAIPSINADQRSVVYCYGLSVDFDTYWERMWEQYQISDDDVERGLIVAGLACSPSESHLKQLLQYSIDGDDVRKQDASSVFSAVYANPLGVDLALEFLDEKFSEVLTYYGSMGSINNIVTGIAGRLTTEKQRDRLEEFVEKYSSSLGSSGEAALETVEDNLLWLNTHADRIIEILEAKELEQYRLPDFVTPNQYDIFLDPALNTKSFLGNVVIDVTAQKKTERITLHSEGIQLNRHSIRSTASSEELLQSYWFDKTHEFLHIELTQPLNADSQYIIDLGFSGTLRENMYGFYYSSYIDENGNEISLAATQFQPTHARKAFPCFDEPSFKANFVITIQTPENYKALGNMPALDSGSTGGAAANVTFERTPKMSTYLVAFVVSDFEYLEDRGSDVVFRTWARSNALEWGRYSIEISRSLLEGLEDYTGIKYKDTSLENPFDKVDQVALPDFSAGAMENWGLITYRETALLYNDGTASAQKSVATIIAHELTHMWFGNLVTTDWWDATWLNEGFAQLFQFFISGQVLPDWRLMDQFLVDHHQGSFASDSLVTSAALTAAAYTPSQVSARFGTITYSKGASVLRMLSGIIGENNFKQALNSYLNEFRYLTTVPDNLFDHLVAKSSDSNLNSNEFRQLLYSWTEQSGFPVISVSRNYGSKTATVSQTRFLLKTPESPDTTSYFVPLTWATRNDDFSIQSPKSYLSQGQISNMVTGMPEEDEWVIFNVQETGYYRVNYDAKNWQLLVANLLDEEIPLDSIHLLNRAQLLDDAFNLARAGQLSYDVAFDLSDYLRRETDFIPFASGLAAFSYLQRMLIHNDRYELFENYVRHLIEMQYVIFNFQDRNSHLEKLFLNRISAWACSLQHEPCTTAASNALQNFLDQREIVPADLRSVVYCYGVRHSSDTYWYKLLEEYKSSLDNAERALLMAGLACTHSEDRLRELLSHSISGEFIRKQDASSVFSSVYGNSKGVEVALDFLDKNFDDVLQYYGSMGSINSIVVGIAGRLTTTDQREQLERFVEEYRDNLGASGPAALETVDENLQWLEKHGEIILDLLHDRSFIKFPSFEDTVTSPATEDTTVTTVPTTDSTTCRASGSVQITVLLVLLGLVALRFV